MSIQEISRAGDSVPVQAGGPSGLVFRGASNLLPGVINESGEVAFKALSSASFSVNSDRTVGIYVQRPGESSLRVVADTTKDADGNGIFEVPGRPDACFDFNPSTWLAPVLNDAGDILFTARYRDPCSGGTLRFGLYATTTTGGPNDIVKIADTQDEVPGFSGVSFLGFGTSETAFLGRTIAALNADREVVFYGRFRKVLTDSSTERRGYFGTSLNNGTCSGGSNDGGACQAEADCPDSGTDAGTCLPPLVRLVDDDNAITPVDQSSSFSRVDFPPVINAFGDVVFTGKLSTSSVCCGGVFTVPVTGGDVSTVAFRGETPSGSTGQLSDVLFGADVNDGGLVTLRATIEPTSSGERGLYVGDVTRSRLDVIADTLGGFAVPNRSSSAEFADLHFAAINESGQIAPRAPVAGSSVSGDEGIYLMDASGSPFVTVAARAMVAPGLSAPAELRSFQGGTDRGGQSAAINDTGNLVLSASGVDENGSSIIGLYFYDACASELVRIADTTTAPLAPPDGLGGAFGTGAALFSFQDGDTRSGWYRAINNSNEVVFIARFTNADFGMYVASIQTAGGAGQLAITCPADVTVECGGDTSPAGTGSATAVDECTGESVATTFSDASVAGCGNTETITRTWTADDGSTVVTCEQIITVVDTTAPVVTCPADAPNLECPADTSVTAHGSASATDNCGAVSIASSDSSVAGCGFTETITRTWTASDECTNSASCDQTIETVDTTPPVLTVDTTPITVTDVDCSGDEAVTLPAASAEDDCDGTVAVTNDAPATFPAGQTTTVTFTVVDACGNASTAELDVTVLHGANIAVAAKRHTVGSGTYPGADQEPLADIEVCAYDKSDGSCARTECPGISHQHYECIATSCPAVGCCTTDGNGQCTINLPPGDYVIISLDATKTVLPDPIGVSASDLLCGETKQKHLVQIVRVDGKRFPAKITRLTGSELLIVEPEFIVWDNTEQPYPFTFESIGEWTVSVSVTPPDGFVADYDELSADVVNELESVQFLITEVGSDLVPTRTVFDVVHNGQRRVVRSAVNIRLTAEYARSRGFDVVQLRTRGLIYDEAKLRFHRPDRSPR